LKCDVAFPIEGFPFDDTKSFSISNVTFEANKPEVFPGLEQRLELQHIKEKIRILGVVRAVDGKDTGEVRDLAYQLVDRAVNIVQFLVTPSLRTVDEVFCIKCLDGPKIDSEFKILNEVIVSFPLDGIFPGGKFDSQKYMEEKLKSFDPIKPDRKETLEKALSYYRIAVCAYNPYQAIESFFGAIQAIVEGENQKEIEKNRARKEIRDYIKPIITRDRGMTDQEFNTKFGCFYGRYRSDGTHGRYHVNDYSQLRDASKAKYEVAKWTWLIINNYIKESSKP
jgi:hypothetical protein